MVSCVYEQDKFCNASPINIKKNSETYTHLFVYLEKQVLPLIFVYRYFSRYFIKDNCSINLCKDFMSSNGQFCNHIRDQICVIARFRSRSYGLHSVLLPYYLAAHFQRATRFGINYKNCDFSAERRR